MRTLAGLGVIAFSLAGCSGEGSLGHGLGSSGGAWEGDDSGSAGSTNLGNAFGNPDRTTPVIPYASEGALPPDEAIGSCIHTQITGAIDGLAFDELYVQDYGLSGYGDEWVYSVPLPRGYAELSGNYLSGMFGATEQTITVSALAGSLTLPPHLPTGDGVACIGGPMEFVHYPNYAEMRYTGISFLSDCEAGTPVEGEVDLCVGDQCNIQLYVEISGETLDTRSSFVATSWTWAQATFFVADGGRISTRTWVSPLDATHAMVDASWIVDSVSGAVYCAGAGSSAEAVVVTDPEGEVDYEIHITLRDLKVVGNCFDELGVDSVVVRQCEDWSRF